MRKAAPPAGLGPKAEELWRDVSGQYALRRDEVRALEDACRTLDLVERMELQLAEDSLVVIGSQGQPVPHPLVTEVRQHRALLVRLLSALHLPEDEESAGTAAQRRSEHGRALAQQRWRRGA